MFMVMELYRDVLKMIVKIRTSFECPNFKVVLMYVIHTKGVNTGCMVLKITSVSVG